MRRKARAGATSQPLMSEVGLARSARRQEHSSDASTPFSLPCPSLNIPSPSPSASVQVAWGLPCSSPPSAGSPPPPPPPPPMLPRGRHSSINSPPQEPHNKVRSDPFLTLDCAVGWKSSSLLLPTSSPPPLPLFLILPNSHPSPLQSQRCLQCCLRCPRPRSPPPSAPCPQS